MMSPLDTYLSNVEGNKYNSSLKLPSVYVPEITVAGYDESQVGQQSSTYGGVMTPTKNQSSGFDTGDLFNLGSKATNTTGSGIMSGIKGAVNEFGTNLGFSSGVSAAAPSASFVGPMAPASGSAFGSATLSGTLGAAGGGAGIGGLTAGLLGGDPTIGSIGGGILGGAAALAGLGPIGWIAGGIIGGLGGKVFNKPRPHPTSRFGGSLTESGGWDTDYKTASKHLDTSFGSTIGTDFNKYTSAFGEMGVKFGREQVFGGVDDGKGFVSVKEGIEGKPEQIWQFDPNDNEARNKAVKDAATYLGKKYGANDEQINGALSRVSLSSTPGSMQAQPRMVTGRKFSNFVKDYNAAPK